MIWPVARRLDAGVELGARCSSRRILSAAGATWSTVPGEPVRL